MERESFKKIARSHQINFRKNNIGDEYAEYETYMDNKSASIGKNFFDGFNIFETVKKRYPMDLITSKKKTEVYSDMLRSEHIPFNLFVPLKRNLEYCKNILNEFFDNTIESINDIAYINGEENIKIEFAPSPKKEYLNDGTSFDTYIEYVNKDGAIGLIGIEVKYTEGEEKLTSGSREEKNLNDPLSKYYEISDKSGLYENGYSNIPKNNILKRDLYRQIWRNQLLAESMLMKNNSPFAYASLLLIYPQQNSHFSNVGEEYMKMLNNKNKFILLTYEQYLDSCKNFCPNDSYRKWLDYLRKRYIEIFL